MGLNLGQILGDASQGFMAGEDRGQSRRNNEELMAQRKIQASDQHTAAGDTHKQMAEQIKAAQTQNKVAEEQMPNTLQVIEWEKKKWDKYNATAVRNSVTGVMKSGARGSKATYTQLNDAAGNSESFKSMWGNQFDMGNSANPEDFKQARDLLGGGNAAQAAQNDPYFDEKVKKMIDEGLIIKGNVNGQSYMVDLDTMSAMTGAYMSPEDKENWEKKQMGILDSKNYMTFLRIE